jgi:hypothetical protein
MLNIIDTSEPNRRNTRKQTHAACEFSGQILLLVRKNLMLFPTSGSSCIVCTQGGNFNEN